MKLLDKNGQPIDAVDLNNQQTSQLVHLKNVVGNHPSRGLTPARLNSILLSAESGNLIDQHELFRDMEERDGHIYAELAKRKRAVIKLDWDIEPPRNASKQELDLTAYVKELLLNLQDFEDMQFDLLDGISHGFSALELEWVRVGSDWTINSFHHRPQTWFKYNLQDRNTLKLRTMNFLGDDLQPFGWMLHQHKAISGYAGMSGLGRVLIWPYLFKNYSVGDLAEFLDVYGLPAVIGKFPQNSSDDEKATLMRAIAGLGHNARGIIPQSMIIEFQNAVTGSEKPFEAMIKWCESTVSKAILGGTLTSNAESTGLGSNAANIQNEVRLDIRDSDCKQLEGTITRDLIFPLLAVNKGFSDIRRCPRFVFDNSEPEDLKLYADSLPKLAEIGMKIPAHWAHTKLKIPQAINGEEVLSAPAPVKSLLPDDVPKKAANRVLAQLKKEDKLDDEFFADQDAIDGAIENLAIPIQQQAEKWLKPAILALSKVDNADEALALLASVNPLTSDDVLVEAIARAMFVVDVLGGSSALNEILNG